MKSIVRKEDSERKKKAEGGIRTPIDRSAVGYIAALTPRRRQKLPFHFIRVAVEANDG
jgi:hypothetical protein